MTENPRPREEAEHAQATDRSQEHGRAGRSNGSDVTESRPDGKSHQATQERKLLLDREARVEAVDGEGEFGRPGARFDRRSPFWVGLTGGLGLAAAALVAWSVVTTREVLLLMLVALIIAIGLEPIVAMLHRHRVPRPAAVAVVSLTGVLVFGGLLALAIPPLVDEVDKLIKQAPHYVETLNNKSSFLGHLNKHFHLVSHLKSALSHGGLSSIESGVIGAGKLVLGIISAIVIMVVLTIYFLADMPRVTRTVYRLVPHSRRARGGLLIDEVFARVGGYVLGNAVTSVVAGLGTLIWLEIWGVPYPLLLAAFVAVMDLIPIVGSTIAGVVVSLVALTVSLPVALGTAAFYIVYRNLEDYLITPRVMKRTVNVSGLVTVIAVLVGGALLGIIGALVAIPVAAAIKLVVEEISYPRLDAS
jgi:predicted PurR-regulated permease PerM